MITYDVHTNLDPEQLTEVAMATFREWLKFALGLPSEVGEMLAWPTGRYAASISWRKTGESRVAIIADEAKAPEARYIEEGTTEADIRAAMLYQGKVSKDGHLYRVIPMRTRGKRPTARGAAQIMSMITAGASGEKVGGAFATLWAKPRPWIDPRRPGVRGSPFVTMTEKPTANNWIVPAMPAYSPAAILARLIQQAVGR